MLTDTVHVSSQNDPEEPYIYILCENKLKPACPYNMSNSQTESEA